MFVTRKNNRFVRQVLLTAMLGLLAIDIAGAMSEQTAGYSPAELAELVGPVALYPDDLIAIILPASSYPLQIVQAARYLKELGKHADLEPDDEWDDAVVALLNYPHIIDLLNEDLDLTWNLGEAVVNQQAAVLDAIQDFRRRAVAAGNLETDDRQTISRIEDVIEITPVDPQVVYVPYYEPDRVVVYQRRPVYRYYPEAYPLYYYPYPARYSFSSGFFWGVTTAYTIGWLTDRVHFHDYGHVSHPYYGRHYARHYTARHAARVRHHGYAESRRHFVSGRRHFGQTWKPEHRHGDRPGRHRATTEHRRSMALNSSRSVRRHRRAGDELVRSSGERPVRTRFSAGQNRKSTRWQETHPANTFDQSRSHRRQADDGRTETRAQSSRREHHSVQNQKRSAPESRAIAKPVSAPATGPAKVTHGTRSTGGRGKFRGGLAEKHGRHRK